MYALYVQTVGLMTTQEKQQEFAAWSELFIAVIRGGEQNMYQAKNIANTALYVAKEKRKEINDRS